MSDDLSPATPEDLAQTLAYGLRFNGKKRVHYADEFMAKIAADHLVAHLVQSGYVLMQREMPRLPDTGYFMRGERKAGT